MSFTSVSRTNSIQPKRSCCFFSGKFPNKIETDYNLITIKLILKVVELLKRNPKSFENFALKNLRIPTTLTSLLYYFEIYFLFCLIQPKSSGFR